ncbi:hypothetical protein HPB47_001376 [Ixodes persulcatus]|uniref:Uncharacterized protein n=1 Tax=Ixodes persulcatus TaxID=34615 RepID=A0AC60PQP9_IXOPE|nr:hypothetical protein HPB47_001376 [Ixodes persulcatus]
MGPVVVVPSVPLRKNAAKYTKEREEKNPSALLPPGGESSKFGAPSDVRRPPVSPVRGVCEWSGEPAGRPRAGRAAAIGRIEAPGAPRAMSGPGPEPAGC